MRNFDFVSTLNMFLADVIITIEQKSRPALLRQAREWRQVARHCRQISAILLAAVGQDPLPQPEQEGGRS